MDVPGVMKASTDLISHNNMLGLSYTAELLEQLVYIFTIIGALGVHMHQEWDTQSHSTDNTMVFAQE